MRDKVEVKFEFSKVAPLNKLEANFVAGWRHLLIYLVYEKRENGSEGANIYEAL